MLKRILVMAVVAATSLTLMAEDKMLPAPDMTAGTTVMEAMANRRSIRKYTERKLTEQELSNLLWAAMGKNREDGRRTAPTCRNFQEIRLFVFDAEGVSEYHPATHSLTPCVVGDYRYLLAAGQDFVKAAPICLVMIADMSKFGNVDERAKMMASVDAGIVSQNISVACAGLGFATVPRAMMQAADIVKLLNLSDSHIAIMNNPVGFEAK